MHPEITVLRLATRTKKLLSLEKKTGMVALVHQRRSSMANEKIPVHPVNTTFKHFERPKEEGVIL